MKILFKISFLDPLFHLLFHLSKFLLQKVLQNRLWNGVGWLWGYIFIILTVNSFSAFFSNPNLSQICINTLFDTGTSIYASPVTMDNTYSNRRVPKPLCWYCPSIYKLSMCPLSTVTIPQSFLIEILKIW